MLTGVLSKVDPNLTDYLNIADIEKLEQWYVADSRHQNFNLRNSFLCLAIFYVRAHAASHGCVLTSKSRYCNTYPLKIMSSWGDNSHPLRSTWSFLCLIWYFQLNWTYFRWLEQLKYVLDNQDGSQHLSHANNQNNTKEVVSDSSSSASPLPQHPHSHPSYAHLRPQSPHPAPSPSTPRRKDSNDLSREVRPLFNYHVLLIRL